ncbi:MAG: hypothetical protein OXC31_15005 [Spirochaetaceae bacterium]|nr:hypothetical protein [Spirochaetaceae bacterium]
MAPKGVVLFRRRLIRDDGIPYLGSSRRVLEVGFRRRALQGLTDNLIGPELHTEQGLRDVRYGASFVVAAAFARHGGGGSNAEHIITDRMAAATNEHGHISALPAAVGVQLVEHEESQTLRRPYQFAILASCEHELQHHVVGQEHIRRVAAHGVSSFPTFLPRVPREAYWCLTLRIARVDELPELLMLAVGERVHRIDDDRLDTAPGTGAQDAVHNGDDVRKALAGAGAGRQYVRPAFVRMEDRLALVPVQRQERTVMVLARLANAEDPRALFGEYSLLDQIVDRAAAAERGVQLEQRLRPEPLRIEMVVDERTYLRVSDLDETARVALVVLDQASSQVEYIHLKSLRLAFRTD